MPYIETEQLHKTYRDSRGQPVPALQGVTLRIEQGEFVAVTGASGCGKSTLLNVLGCLDRPDSGNYRCDGQEVGNWPETHRAAWRNKRIGFIFQSFHLLPFLTVEENVQLPFLYSSDRKPERAQIGDVLQSVELAGMERRYPSELSGGQQQRVAIARALVLGANLFLADEPTGNLDAATAKSVLDVFDQLIRERKTIVLVTHDANVAARANRQVRMERGTIASDKIAANGETR